MSCRNPFIARRQTRTFWEEIGKSECLKSSSGLSSKGVRRESTSCLVSANIRRADGVEARIHLLNAQVKEDTNNEPHTRTSDPLLERTRKDSTREANPSDLSPGRESRTG